MIASNLKTLFFFIITFHISISESWGQLSYVQPINQAVLPTIFSLDQFEEATYGLMPDYEPLLHVCNNDVEVAFTKWLEMLLALEATASQEQVSLGGMKAWVRIFFRADGSIEHFGYYLKPDSKRMNHEALALILEKFVNKYRFPAETNHKFTHYTTINFPTYANP